MFEKFKKEVKHYQEMFGLLDWHITFREHRNEDYTDEKLVVSPDYKTKTAKVHYYRNQPEYAQYAYKAIMLLLMSRIMQAMYADGILQEDTDMPVVQSEISGIAHIFCHVYMGER